MLRLGRLTDYAIVIAASLADREGYKANARDLAEVTGIPWPTVVKLLKLLARARVLSSIQGRRGGYALARPPGGIDLVEIIEAVEGRIGLTECNRESRNCEILASCLTQRHWQVINRSLREALRGIRLADLTGAAPTLVAGTRPFGEGLLGDGRLGPDDRPQPTPQSAREPS
jgi:FeS assembly SUF system regulator